MFHINRHWSITRAESSDELAQMLTQRTWTLCSGFAVRGQESYVFLNDATSEDGAQEYGVLLAQPSNRCYRQIDSITFGWCRTDKAKALIDEILNGSFDQCDYGSIPYSRVTGPEMVSEHHCVLCA